MGSTPDRPTIRLAVVTTVVLVLVAACSTGSYGASSGTSAAPAATSVASPAAAATTAPSTSSGGGKYGNGNDDEYNYGGTATATPAASAGGAAKVHTVSLGSGSVGSYLTGEGGMTLYVFGNDSANTSTCDADCAAGWPPFTVAKGDTLKGASGVKGALTTFSRADGSMQVAYGGSPLYYYSGDKAAGDTKGQGVGDVWFIAQP
jgi:predicted lipoprotein with Yx(FWY)xxD motif